MEFKITNYGVMLPGYFPGHGIALSIYTHTATGIGASEREALGDALDQLAESLPEDVLDSIEKEASVSEDTSDYDEVNSGGDDSHETAWLYLSLDVRM